MTDLILPTDEQVERAKEARLTARGTPYYEAEEELVWSLVLLLNKDKILGELDPARPDGEDSINREPQVHFRAGVMYPLENAECFGTGGSGPTKPDGGRDANVAVTYEPFALTDIHARALETAIRAEGYDIHYDTSTGEFKLERKS
jgi:hypothetical protein